MVEARAPAHAAIKNVYNYYGASWKPRPATYGFIINDILPPPADRNLLLCIIDVTGRNLTILLPLYPRMAVPMGEKTESFISARSASSVNQRDLHILLVKLQQRPGVHSDYITGNLLRLHNYGTVKLTLKLLNIIVRLGAAFI